MERIETNGRNKRFLDTAPFIRGESWQAFDGVTGSINDVHFRIPSIRIGLKPTGGCAIQSAAFYCADCVNHDFARQSR